MRHGLALLALAAVAAACGNPTPPPDDPQPATAVAEPAGEHLLSAVTAAERALVYSGYKTAVHGEDGQGRRTRMRVSRLADGRMVLAWERDGASGKRWIVRARHRWIEDPSLLLRNYEVAIAEEPENDVAWRAVQRVELRPRRGGRPSMTLLVDAETHLVLAERLRDHDGVQRFAWQFDAIDYVSEDAAVDEAEVVAAPERDEVRPGDADAPLLVLGSPPSGFERIASRRSEDGGVVEYWSDGLAAFAFRQTPSRTLAGPDDGALTVRSCSGRSSVTGTVEGVEIRLLGSLPAEELEAAAASLRLRPQ